MQLCKKASPLFEMDATEIQKDFAGPFYCACRVNVEELMRKSMMGEVK
jgi:hypothetical protein